MRLININKKPVFALLIVLCLINMCAISSNGLVTEPTNECSECSQNGRYIVKFKDLSILEYFSEIKENKNDRISVLSAESSPVILTKINNFRNKLKTMHIQAKTDILNVLEKGQDSRIFSNEFFNIFNGIVVQNIKQDDVEKIKSLSFVESVFPDLKIKANLEESVPLINASEVWKCHDMQGNNLTGKGVTIAIIDTGINYDLSEFGGGFGPGYTVIDGYDFVTCEDIDGDDCLKERNPDDDPMDDDGHGTLCASIAIGVAPDVKLIAYKTLNKEGEGWWSWSQSAMDRAMDPNNDGDFSDHVDVISLSVGGYGEDLNPDIDLCIEVDNVVKSGIVVVAAAGNNGTVEHINFPGMSRETICVGASTKTDRIAGFSSRGPVKWGGNILIKPDVVAPGVSIRCLHKSGNYYEAQGTSFSTPHVSGAAALILQAHPDWAPTSTSNKVKEELKNTAVKLVDGTGVEYNETTQGAGRIDVLAAVNLSSAPPIAFLNISGKLIPGLINITGIAKNGTGSSDDFVNYTLSYKECFKQRVWTELKTSTVEVENEIFYVWNIIDLKESIYELKLIVRGKDQASVDIKEVWFGEVPYIDVQMPENVSERSKFNVVLTDENYKPIRALVIFIAPLRMPRIRYGSNVSFKAPRIVNPLKENVEGKIIVIKVRELLIVQETILIENN